MVRLSSLLLLGLLGEKNRVDVGENTAGGDGDAAKKLVELLVVADSELNVAGDDTGLLVVTGSVAGKLENLSGEVLHDSSEVDGSTSANAGGVLADLQVAVHTTDRELKASLLGAGDGLSALGLATTSCALACLSGHCEFEYA
jgi:hypothetical protein